MATQKRQRELERQRYQRQQERRNVEYAKRRQRQQALAAVVAVCVVIVAFVVLATQVGNKASDDTVRSAENSAAAADAAPTDQAQDGGQAPTLPSEAVPATTQANGQITCQYYGGNASAKQISGKPAATAPALASEVIATLRINGQPVTLNLQGQKAPCTTRSFIHLAKQGYFDKTVCHRVTKGVLSVVQCGDPSGTGGGGPGYSFGTENLPSKNAYPKATLAMAKSASPNSNGSQFFIVYADSQLSPDYTVFGTVTSGLPWLIEQTKDLPKEHDGPPSKTLTIDSVSIS